MATYLFAKHWLAFIQEQACDRLQTGDDDLRRRVVTHVHPAVTRQRIQATERVNLSRHEAADLGLYKVAVARAQGPELNFAGRHRCKTVGRLANFQAPLCRFIVCRCRRRRCGRRTRPSSTAGLRCVWWPVRTWQGIRGATRHP